MLAIIRVEGCVAVGGSDDDYIRKNKKIIQ
jgi:hypothetical protein